MHDDDDSGRNAAETNNARPSRAEHGESLDTSAIAFRESRPRAKTQQARILELVHQRGEHGVTAWEVHEILPFVMYPSAAAALNKLGKKRLIHANGKYRIATINMATVWIAGPPPPDAPPRQGRARLPVLLTQIAHLRARGRHDAAADLTGERAPCPHCGEEVELVVNAPADATGDP